MNARRGTAAGAEGWGGGDSERRQKVFLCVLTELACAGCHRVGRANVCVVCAVRPIKEVVTVVVMVICCVSICCEGDETSNCKQASK